MLISRVQINEKDNFVKKVFYKISNGRTMGCITSKTVVISENPNQFDVIFADTEQTIYYNAKLEINGKFVC